MGGEKHGRRKTWEKNVIYFNHLISFHRCIYNKKHEKISYSELVQIIYVQIIYNMEDIMK